MARKKTAGPAPDAAYLLALKRELVSAYQSDDAQIDRMRGVRALTTPVLVDDSLRLVDIEVRDPTIADEIQRVVATLSLNAPKLQVTPARVGTDIGEANATLREKWTEETLQVAGRRIPGRDAFRDMVDAAVADGGAWVKLVFTKDTWDERYSVDAGKTAREYDAMTEEAKKAAGPPFTWQCCDVRGLYPVWQGPKLAEVMEVSRRPINSTLRAFRLGLRQGADGWQFVPEDLGQPINMVDQPSWPQYVNFIEHWTEDWVSYVLEIEHTVDAASGSMRVSDAGKIATQFKHGLGRVPYFFAPGYTFGWQWGRKIGQGIAETKRWLVEYRSYLMTLHAQVAARDAFPPIVRRLVDASAGSQGDDNLPTKPEYWEFRQIYNLDAGEELKVLEFPGVGQALKDEIANVSSLIDKMLTPRITAEIGSGLEGAGFAINQVLAEARVQQDPITKHVEQALEEMTRFLWQIVRDKVQEKVWVRSAGTNGGWLGAGPDDLGDDVGIEWQLDPERPSAKLIEERYWGERLQQGSASIDQAIEAMGDNPDEVRLGRAMDRIRATPWYQQIQDNMVKQAVGRGDLIQQAIQAQQNATAGMLPGQPQQPGQPGGMGSQGIPDMGNLAVTPGGGGNVPQPAALGSLGGAARPVTQQPGAIAP